MKSTSQHLGGIMSNISNKDDEEDELQALRLAALESLRVKGLPPPPVVPPPTVNVPPPQPVLPNNQIFKRHLGNQNLIAIIPVEPQSSVSAQYQKPPLPIKNPPSLLDLRVPPPPQDALWKNQSPGSVKESEMTTATRVKHGFDKPAPQVVEEKPKIPTKFSRFEDSDSEEDEDDVEMSMAKSDNEEEEIVVEATDADDIVIEILDEELADDEISEIILEEPEDELTAEPSEHIQTPSQTDLGSNSSPPLNSCSDVQKRSRTPERSNAVKRRPVSPVHKSVSANDQRSTRDNRNETNHRTADDSSSRSPKFGTRSPTSRRRSPSRSQRSPIRSKRSPIRRSPIRSQKSPVRSQRSPPRVRSPLRSHRSPMRSQRSPERKHRSPTRSQRSPPRSPLRPQRSPQRSLRSPPRTQSNKSPPPKYNPRDKQRTETSSRTGSVMDRLGSKDTTKTTELSKSSRASNGDASLSQRSADSKRTNDRSRSPIIDRKILVRRSSPASQRSNTNEDSNKSEAPLDIERERLELRKRKFGMPVDIGTKKDGKIRLRTETTSSPRPPDQLGEDKVEKKSSDQVPIKVRKEEQSFLSEKSPERYDSRSSKNGKKPSRKSRDERRQNKTRGLQQKEEPASTVKLAGAKSKESSPDSTDLRAELQRRRNNRYEDEEPRSRTPETRRILVLNSPSSAPPTAAQKGTTKSSAEPSNGVLSKQKRSLDSQTKLSSSDAVSTEPKRGTNQNAKRSLLKPPIELDKGRETTDPLEDRIRHIRAQNELIRKRQLEIEADKLQYA